MRVVFSLIVMLLFASCISKKKHNELVQELKKAHLMQLNEQVNILKKDLNSEKDTVFQLRLNLAERKGENNILAALAEKMENRVKALESDLESAGKQSQSSQQNLSTSLHQKEAEIKRLNNLLDRVNATLDKYVATFEILSENLQTVVEGYHPDTYIIAKGQDRVIFTLNEKLIFRKGRTTTLADDSYLLLEKFSGVLNTYPNMNVQITGHTDNSTPPQSYKDNWNVSVLRAAVIARTLIDDFDVNANQILAAGKGEYSPATSNETAQGRIKNRRIEFSISPRAEELVNSIRSVLEN